MAVIARKTDRTSCPGHAEGEIIEGFAEVVVCHEPVARLGDKVRCKDGSIQEITDGEETVLIGGKPVARKGDATAHGGVILAGCPRVLVGRGKRARCKIAAARERAAFIKYSVHRRSPFLSEV